LPLVNCKYSLLFEYTETTVQWEEWVIEDSEAEYLDEGQNRDKD